MGMETDTYQNFISSTDDNDRYAIQRDSPTRF